MALALLGTAALANAAVLLIPDPAWACVAALLLTVGVPGGLLAVLLVPTDDTDPVEWTVAALGLGVVALTVNGLILSYLPLTLVSMSLLVWFDGLALGLAALVLQAHTDWRLPRSSPAGMLLDVLVVVGLGAALRLPDLGYSEFQGDEIKMLMAALAVLQDVPDGLFYHGKGPAEVLVTAVQYGLVGALSEASARLPFTLANLAGLAAVYLLARRLLGRPGALATALLLVFSGYLVVFGRFAQYQSLVFFLSVLAIWCVVRWSRGQPAARWPVLAGLFAGCGALAHYDAIFALPPIALLALGRRGFRGLLERRAAQSWLAGGAVGLGLILLFFGPYLLHPLYDLAEARFVRRGVGTAFPRNNLPEIWLEATRHASAIYLVLVGGLASLGTGWLVARRLAGRGRDPGARAWAVGALWFAVPFAFYAFGVRMVGTHIHVAGSGLALLGGWAVAALWAAGAGRVWRLGIIAVFSAALALVASYVVPVYLQTSRELVRRDFRGFWLAWAANTSSVKGARLGFPHQRGWKVIGDLYEQGWLRGTFDAGRTIPFTHWYTRDAWRCAATPRYYFVNAPGDDEPDADDEEEEAPAVDHVAAGYPIVGIVTVAEQPRLLIRERGAPSDVEPRVWAVEALAERFDRDLSRPDLDPGPWGRGPVPTSYTPARATFGGVAELLGYRLYVEDARPGGVVRADLYWAPLVSSARGYPVNLRLGQEGRLGDGSGLGCEEPGASRAWVAGQSIVQHASLAIAAEAPPGRHPILVGVSSPAGGGLLPSTDLPMYDGLVEIATIDLSARVE